MQDAHPALPPKAFAPFSEEKESVPGAHAVTIYEGAYSVSDLTGDKFNSQFTTLVIKLQALYKDDEIPEKLSSNLVSFKDNFLNRNYRSQPRGYYTETKYWLEHLYLTLLSEEIPKDYKKQMYCEFLESLEHCAPSVITRIQQIIMTLKGPQSSEFHQWLAILRTEIIAEIASRYCQNLVSDVAHKIRIKQEELDELRRGDMDYDEVLRISELEYQILDLQIRSADIVSREVHYQKCLLEIASDLGWNPVIIESVADSEYIELEPEDEMWFRQEFCHLYNPQTIIRHIAEQITWRIREKISSMIPKSDGQTRIVPVKNLGEIESILDSIPALSRIPDAIDWLLYYTTGPVNPENAELGFLIPAETNYYYLIKPLHNLAFQLIPHFYDVLIRDDSPWTRPKGTGLLTPPDELGYRYFVLPYAPLFCYVITPANVWIPMDGHSNFINPSTPVGYIPPVSTFESIAWGLNLSPVTWDTFLAYITNGKTDFRHCVIGNLDLRGLPLNLAETALRVQTECVKTIDLYQARQIYVTEESPSLQRLREIAQDLLSTSQLNIEDSLPLADPSDWTAFDFFAVFRYCNTRINTLNHFFAQACLENGYTKKYLTFGVVPGMSSEDYSCLAYALQTGRYNTLLTIELCQKYLNTAQVQILADALGSGRCQEGLFVCLKRAVLKARHVQIMMSAVMNGHFPEQGGIEFDFTRSKNPLDTRQASLTHIAEMLESGKCPEGFRLTLSGADFAGQNAIIPLCRALNSGRFARNVCIDLAGSRTDEFTLIDLVSALERGPRPVGLDIRLNPDQGEHGRVKTLMSRLHSLLTETVLDMGPTPDNAPASNTPGENPRDAGDEKEDFSLSWCEFFSSPKHKTQRPSSENSSDISFSLD